jgi:hypothetical protein
LKALKAEKADFGISFLRSASQLSQVRGQRSAAVHVAVVWPKGRRGRVGAVSAGNQLERR